jgi:hypothetical protein
MGIALRARPRGGRVMRDAARIGDVHSTCMRGVHDDGGRTAEQRED